MSRNDPYRSDPAQQAAPADAGEPIRENGAGDGRRPDGTFAPGNQVARQHGPYAARQPAELLAVVEEFTAGVVSDLGGASELSTIERAYVGRLGRVELTLRLLEADIAEHGLMTSAGGVRKVYAQYLAGLDRWDRLAQRLGLRRRQRRVPSLREALDQVQIPEGW